MHSFIRFISISLLLSLAGVAHAQCDILKDPVDPERYYYDLTPLMDDVWDYRMYFDPTHTLHINVCRPLVVPESGCDTDAASCLKAHAPHESIFMGQTVRMFSYVEPGHLEMRYMNGTDHRNVALTIIRFKCVAEAGEGYPVFDEFTRDVLHLVWFTEHACAKRRDTCVYNNGTGRVDLTSIAIDKRIAHPLYTSPALWFHINACKPLKTLLSAPCATGTFACITDASNVAKFNLGVTQLLVMENHVLTNLITNGEPCGSLGTFHTVRIQFPCANEDAIPAAYFASESMCQHLFVWPTTLTCGY
jgi:hypothetical protein